MAIENCVTLYSTLLILAFTPAVLPGANDLHFYDGSSMADIIAGDVFFEVLDPPELGYSYRIRPAKDFGTPFNDSLHFVKARLVPTIPLHSCSDILNHEDIVGQIALSQRGTLAPPPRFTRVNNIPQELWMYMGYKISYVPFQDLKECSFVYKTAKAQQAGARAMIITESIDKWDESLDHLIEMVDDKMDVDVNIPAGFLLGRSGFNILRTLRKLKKSYAVINLPINMTHIHINKMNQPPWIAW